MLDDVPQWLVDCGPLVGVKVPQHGYVPGIKVEWLDPPPNQFFILNPELGISMTDKDGVATLTATPKNEFLPGVGMPIISPSYVMDVRVWLFYSNGNVLGIPVDIFRVHWSIPEFRYDFGLHGGYRIDFGSLTWESKVNPNDHGGNGVYTYSEHWLISSCNQDPYQNDWKATIQLVRPAIPDNPAYILGVNSEITRKVHFSEGAPSTFLDYAQGTDQLGPSPLIERTHLGMNVEINLIPSNPAKATLTLTPAQGGYGYIMGSRSATALIQPYPSCTPQGLPK